MTATLFTNVKVIDGTGEAPFAGEVLVKGNRIIAVAHAPETIEAGDAAVIDASVIDCNGATLMPGLTDAHGHLSFLNAENLESLIGLSDEALVLQTANFARLLLDHGYTSLFSGSSVRAHTDIAIRDAINAGDIAGPRLLAATQQMTVTGGFGDVGRRGGYAVALDGADAFRDAARQAARDGVDTFKIVPSAPGSGRDPLAEDTAMTDEEVAAVCEVARQRGRRVAAHARSADAVKMCLRHGVDVIYHATLADAEAKDMLEAAKDRIFVAPAMGLPYARLHDGEAYGVATDDYTRARAEKEIETVSAAMAELHRRGVRVLPGGDYGFKWNPHGKNARDLFMFVECFGFTPLEAIRAATEWGGQLMGPGLGLGDELGQVREGYLADLLLVDGDPAQEIEILQDRDRLLAIMKDGAFHKAPPSDPLVRRQAAE